MRGETWKNLLGIDKIPNRSTIYEVTESVLHTACVSTLLGQVAALVMCHMNGLILLERTMQQITETMPLGQNNNSCYNVTKQREKQVYKRCCTAEVVGIAFTVHEHVLKINSLGT